MDYIREALLRQQALLVILLTGQRAQPTEEPQRRRERPDPLRAGEGNAARPRSDEAAGTAAGADPPEDSAVEAALRRVLTGKTGEQDRRADSGRDGLRQGTGTGGQSAGAESAGSPAAGQPDQGGGSRWVVQLRRAERPAPADPAELSRAFQRDSRRYDGGFRLY